MSDSAKMNALDFVIVALKEHEKTLDSLSNKLEKALKNLSEASGKTKPRVRSNHNVKIICEEWSEFKDACIGAEAVSFQLEDGLRVQALQDNIIYEYREPIPTRIENMRCGIQVKFQAPLKPFDVKRFFLKELNVQDTGIMQGEIQFPR